MIKKCKRVGCFEQALTVDGFCLVHTHRRGVRKAYNDSPRVGKPLLWPHGWLSCELETCVDSCVDLDRLSTISRWSCRDGSLPGGGIEFKVLGKCCSKCSTVTLAEEVARRAAVAGLRVSTQCGFHVHVDMRGIWEERINSFLIYMHSRQYSYRELLPPSRRENAYCRFTEGEYYSSEYYYNHYNWVNITNHGSIEVRIHGGTLNPLKIRGWLSYWKDVGHWLRSEKDWPASIEDFSEGIGREYILARRNAAGVLRTLDAQPATEREE